MSEIQTQPSSHCLLGDNDQFFSDRCQDIIISGDSGQDIITDDSDQDIMLGGDRNRPDILHYVPDPNFTYDHSDVTYGADDNRYILNRAYGKAEVLDPGGNDTLLIGGYIKRSDIAFFKDGKNLVVDGGKGDTLLIKQQANPNNTIELFQHEVGGNFSPEVAELSADDVNCVVQTMAAYAEKNGVDFSSVDAVKKNAELMNIMVNSWDHVDQYPCK